MKKFFILSVLLFLLTPMAAANGAMGLALEIFDFRIWAVYVLATVIMEAWMIGRSIEFGWAKSLVLSVGFNFLTAFCCAGGLFAPFLHSPFFGGPILDGSPLLWTLELLVVYGLISAFVESALWSTFCRKDLRGRALGRTYVAHAWGVPLALCILLIPSRPYVGWEGMIGGHRSMELHIHLRNIYDGRIAPNGVVKQFQSVEELEQRLNDLGGYGICLYPAVYHRFDLRDHREKRFSVELNHDLSPKTDWLIRIKRRNGTLVVGPLGTLGDKDEPFMGTETHFVEAKAAK